MSSNELKKIRENILITAKAPCVGCNKRSGRCITSCEEYAEYKELLKYIKSERAKEKALGRIKYD